MNYLNEFKDELEDIISEGRIDEAVDFAAEKVLESYKNGKKAGSEPKKPSASKPRFSKTRR